MNSNCSMCVLVTQSCLTLCDPMDCSLLGSSIHGILQARILEWEAIPCSRGSSQPRDWTEVSHIATRFFTIWATRVIWHQMSCSKVFWLILGSVAKMRWAETLSRTPSSLLPEIGEFHLCCPSAPCKWIWMICLPLVSMQPWVHKGMGRGHDCCSTSCIMDWKVPCWGYITGEESETPEKKLVPGKGESGLRS